MLAINFHIVSSSLLYGNYLGQVYALCILAITAAETTIGLSILVLLYRIKGDITFNDQSTLRG